MTIDDMIKYLLKQKELGKGDYIVIDDGYLNEILEENIRIDDKNKEIIL